VKTRQKPMENSWCHMSETQAPNVRKKQSGFGNLLVRVNHAWPSFAKR